MFLAKIIAKSVFTIPVVVAVYLSSNWMLAAASWYAMLFILRAD